MIKTVKRTFMLFLCLSFFPLMGIAQSSWKSPEYKAESYRKVMVLAKTTDELAKRQIEDFTVKLLMEKGITAIPAYSNITDADISTEEKLIAKADELQVDALLAYSVTGKKTQIKNTPRLDANIGVPVRVGIFRGFLGTSVPIAGGARSVAVVNVTASFYNRSSQNIQWSKGLNGKLKKGTDKLASGFAKETVNRMMKDGLFIQ